MIAYSEAAEKPIQVFKGICKGTIVKSRGDNQFGWDPCFQPDGFDQTFAEMDVKVKNEMSHRFNSLKALREYLIQLKN